MRNFQRQNEVAQKACMQHEGCYKYPVRRPVRLCAIIQKEAKVIQNFIAHLPGKVKEAIAANSLTSKRAGELGQIGKKRNTYKNNRSNVKRKFRYLNQKGQNENFAKHCQIDSKTLP